MEQLGQTAEDQTPKTERGLLMELYGNAAAYKEVLERQLRYKAKERALADRIKQQWIDGEMKMIAFNLASAAARLAEVELRLVRLAETQPQEVPKTGMSPRQNNLRNRVTDLLINQA